MDRLEPQQGPLSVMTLNAAIQANAAEHTPATMTNMSDATLEAILEAARQRGALPVTAQVLIVDNGRGDTGYAAKEVLELPATVTTSPAPAPAPAPATEPEPEADNGVVDAAEFLQEN